jgi:hypothetical protein
MKTYALIIGSVLALCVIGFWAVGFITPKSDGLMCTAEERLCPDGSYIGRTGPNCAFAACPDTSATSTGTTPGGQGILPYKGGIHGTILLGPTCPVERIPPDPQCADKPYATSVEVYRTGSAAPFLIGTSDARGTFQFSLPPGSYTVQAGGSKMLPRCSPVTVTVGPSGYSAADISCDTGIR